MRRLWADLPEACDNTLLIAERCEVEFAEGRNLMPRFAGARRRDRGVVVRQGGRGAASSTATPAASLPRFAQRADLELGVILQMGFPRLLPGHRRLHQLGQGSRASGSVRVGFGRRRRSRRTRCGITDLDPLVHGLIFERFLNPERVVDARHRHRLRRASARRGDPLRQREVRRRPGRADRHLRHHQGQAGDQGRQPGARLPVRDGRADHQGAAARRDGQGHPAERALRPRRTPALRRGGRVPQPATTPTPTSARSYDTAAQLEGLRSGSGVCTRPA